MQNLIFQKLADLGIENKTYYHQPLFTSDQAKEMVGIIPATQCKNLFLKDNKKNVYLVVAVADSSHETKISLKNLSKYLQAPGLRFADAQLLQHYLNVQPGSVTPFGLIFDKDHKVMVLLDAALFKHQYIGFHPLENTATTIIASSDFIKFIDACMNKSSVLDFNDSILRAE